MTPSTPTRLITMPTNTRPRRPPVLAVIPTLPAAIPKPRRVITSPTNAIVCSSSFPRPDTYRSACSHGFAFMNRAIDAASATTNTSSSTMLPSANSDHPKKVNAARNNSVANPCVEFAPINSLLTSIRLRCPSPGTPHPTQAVARFDVGTSCVKKSGTALFSGYERTAIPMQRGSGHHVRVAGCADDEREQRCDDHFPDECRACSHPLLLSNGGLPPSGRSTDLPYSLEGPSFTCNRKKSRIAAALVGRAANRTPSGDGS